MAVKGFYKKDGKTHPVTKSKHEPRYTGQTEEPSWKESSIHDLNQRYIYDVELKGRGGITVIYRETGASKSEAKKEALEDFNKEPLLVRTSFGKPEVSKVTEIEKV